MANINYSYEPAGRLSEGEFSSIINELHQSGYYTSDELSLITTVLSEHSSAPSLDLYEEPGLWLEGESEVIPQPTSHEPPEVGPVQIQLGKEEFEHLVETLLRVRQQREEEAHESRSPEPSMEERTQSHADDLAQQLHDKRTRGESLSAEEKAQLKNWYALQDNAESKALGLTAAEKTSATLQAQIDTAQAELAGVAKRIQKIAAENKTLRREIAALRRQLAHPPT